MSGHHRQPPASSPCARRPAATQSRTHQEAGEVNRPRVRRTVVALDARTARSASHRYNCPPRTAATDVKGQRSSLQPRLRLIIVNRAHGLDQFSSVSSSEPCTFLLNCISFIDAAYCYRCSVCLSVCLCVGHTGELCNNG